MTAFSRREVLAGLLATGAAATMFPRFAGAAGTDGLRSLADSRRLRVGSAIDPSMLGDAAYKALVVAQCNTILPRNGLKWNTVERSAGVFNFGEADKTVAFAEQNKLSMRGHTLVWYRVPNWVNALKTPDDVTAAMTRHINTTMGRYAGKVASWDVVNEPFEYDSPDIRNCVFLKQLGEQYIDLAFKTAHAADPACELVLNETHLYKAGDVYDAKRKAVLALLDRLQSRNVPINALGVQGHVRPGLDKIDADAFASFCRDLKSRGLALLLTDLDASCRYIKRVPGFKPADYGKPIADLISIAQANAKLSAVIFWGLSPHGLKPNEPGSNPECRYLINLFDDDLQPLPSFDAVEAALKALPSS